MRPYSVHCLIFGFVNCIRVRDLGEFVEDAICDSFESNSDSLSDESTVEE